MLDTELSLHCHRKRREPGWWSEEPLLLGPGQVSSYPGGWGRPWVLKPDSLMTSIKPPARQGPINCCLVGAGNYRPASSHGLAGVVRR